MKVLAIIAMFAFVAVQLSHAAPTPEEEKKEAGVVPAAAVAADATSQPTAEAKSGAPETAASPVETAAPAEEKKP